MIVTVILTIVAVAATGLFVFLIRRGKRGPLV
jgi:hypothetical protein